MDPNQQQLLLGYGGAGDKVYAEDVFANSRYNGATGQSIRVYNGINLDTTADGGGMIMSKAVNASTNWVICDTARGTNKYLSTNSSGGPQGSHGFNGYYTDGFNVNNNSETNVNEGGRIYQNFTWKKQKGFFDVVKYTGTGAGQSGFAHGLEAEVGFMVIKNINSGEWYSYHNKFGKDYYVELSNSAGMVSNSSWLPTAPTSTHFYVNNTGTNPNVNQNNVEYIAYLWAGAQDTNTATSRSVELDGGEYLVCADSANNDFYFGTGDFTVEGWVWIDNYNEIIGAFNQNSPYYGWLVSTNFGCSQGQLAFYHNSAGSGGITQCSNVYVPKGQWSHFAVTRSGNTFRMFLNGAQVKQWTEAAEVGDPNQSIHLGADTNPSPGRVMTGKLSNIRIVKGTAVYTSSFKVPTEPLKNITNTKLLCCNNASVTGSTVAPGAITVVGSPSANISTPFFDPNSFIFGETMDQSMVQCGEYTGDGSSDAWGSMKVHLGWEPDWCLVKDTSNTGNRWRLFCSQNRWGRAPGSAGYTNIIYPDRSQAQDDSSNVSFPYEDGFAYTNGDGGFNGNGIRYIYIAIRRPDGRVTRPPEAGTELFQTNLGSAGNPNYKNNPTYPYFRVDFSWKRIPSNSDGTLMGSRITLDNYWNIPSNASAQNAAWLMGAMDYQDGYAETYYGGSGYQSWSWKRGLGMDVVCYRGSGESRTIKHNLGVAPEMIWIKRRAQSGNSGDWMVGHKDLYGGTNPWSYYLVLNKDQAEANDFAPFDSFAPTADAFGVGTSNRVNNNDDEYVAYLFASVPGFSKIGAYAGSSSNVTLDLGFTPRFFLCKARTQPQSTYWAYFDSVRGISSGTTPRLSLNVNDANNNGTFVSTTASGIVLTTSFYYQNENGYNYIYYAHA